jgi:hypothetical protein
MSFSNTEYLYQHLPGRMRRDDAGAFLKRFLSWVGNELDGVDQKLDTFYLNIAPGTATSEFIDWWLYALFGWGWFPTWFTLDERRNFYSHMTQHLARRGTPVGIQKFLADFGVGCVVETGPTFWGDFFWDERGWLFTGPNVMVVRLFPQYPAVSVDAMFWGEAAWGDDYWGEQGQNIQLVDVDQLLRWEWPLAQFMFIEELPIGFRPERGAPLEYGEGEYGSAIPG